MSARVCRVPRCSGLTTGASGRRSCSADRISTRLIESMPRSASSVIPSSSISAGYPVFSAITARSVCWTSAGVARRGGGRSRRAAPAARKAAMSREGVQGAEVLGLDDRGVGQAVLQRRQDLDALDRVDAQVRVQRHPQLQHLRRVPRLLRDHLQEDALDVLGGGAGDGGRRWRGRRRGHGRRQRRAQAGRAGGATRRRLQPLGLGRWLHHDGSLRDGRDGAGRRGGSAVTGTPSDACNSRCCCSTSRWTV